VIKLQISIKSVILLRPVQISAFFPYGFTTYSLPYKVVWMLHSAIGDSGMFADNTALSELANQKGFAFIAPSLGNGFFVDSGYERQAAFLSQEFLPVMRQMLHVSPKREDNALLGVSMGGFGAVRWAMDTPEMFSAVASISANFRLPVELDERVFKSREQRLIYQIFEKELIPRLFYDKDGKLLPHADLVRLMDNPGNKNSLPRIGLYCGDRDYLALNQNTAFFEHCKTCGVPAELYITDGGHNPEYWNVALLEAVNRLFPDK